MKPYTKALAPAIAGLFLLCARPAAAQSTIFTVPTTDTVAKGKVDLRLNWWAQNPNTHLDRLHILDSRILVGVPGNIEIGANVRTNLFHRENHELFEPNIKWKFVSSDSKGLAASVGAVLVTPLNDRVGMDTYGLLYGNVSKKVTGSNFGPRFTAGPYGVVGGGRSWYKTKAGAILGYEQPIHSRASIIADWTSGKNDVGYFTPGMSFAIPVIGRVKGGYSFGNDGYHENRFLFVSYGITL